MWRLSIFALLSSLGGTAFAFRANVGFWPEATAPNAFTITSVTKDGATCTYTVTWTSTVGGNVDLQYVLASTGAVGGNRLTDVANNGSASFVMFNTSPQRRIRIALHSDNSVYAEWPTNFTCAA